MKKSKFSEEQNGSDRATDQRDAVCDEHIAALEYRHGRSFCPSNWTTGSTSAR
jgi:hypothetical protein